MEAVDPALFAAALPPLERTAEWHPKVVPNTTANRLIGRPLRWRYLGHDQMWATVGSHGVNRAPAELAVPHEELWFLPEVQVLDAVPVPDHDKHAHHPIPDHTG